MKSDVYGFFDGFEVDFDESEEDFFSLVSDVCADCDVVSQEGEPLYLFSEESGNHVLEVLFFRLLFGTPVVHSFSHFTEVLVDFSETFEL